MKKVEALFNNIVHFSILYLEKLPKFIQDTYNSPYDKYTYLQSLPMSYLEASYELIMTLKSIFGLSSRAKIFKDNFSEHIKTNFVLLFVEIGCINLVSRFMKEYRHIKM